MDKIKTEKEILNWVSSKCENFIVTEKLDGCSCLVCIDVHKNVKMFTRGDGIFGTDISFLFKEGYVNFPTENSLIVRGELIIDIKTFNDRYSKQFSNARNLVSGIVNSKKINKLIQKNDVKFVAYEIITPNGKSEKIQDQLKALDLANFLVVDYFSTQNLSYDCLKTKLIDRKEKSLYEIDGLIITENVSYQRCIIGNPTNAIAFKMDTEKAETTVLNVTWSESKWLKLKPVVSFVPVNLSGVTICSASGYNARFIESNGIGPGAKIEVILSGEVITKIINVITKSVIDGFPNFPFEWLDGNVDIAKKNINFEIDEVNSKLVYGFFSKIGVMNLGL
jgi:DNA ligase (NAD+)